MRILWVSNAPWAHSGYGNQTALFLPRIRDLGHEAAIFAFWGLEGSMLEWNGIRVYPKHVAAFGQDIAGAHGQHWRADLIITLIDVWVTAPDLCQGIPVAAWAPVDHDPIPPPVTNKLRQCFMPIAYSQFGLQQMAHVGLDARYVPHGVDTVLYSPIDRAKAREKLRWPTDRFIVGLVAANKGCSPIRKSFYEQLKAFAKLKSKHKDALLYIHSNLDAPAEWQPANIPAMMAHLGLKEGIDVAWCSQYEYYSGMINEQYMALIYNAFDVLLNVSRGEGFGLTPVEAQACGTPVIVGAWTAMKELCFSGWTVPHDDDDDDWTMQNSCMIKPKPSLIAKRLEWAYAQSGSDDLRTKAREGALQYDADAITQKFWKPVLAELEDRISRPQLMARPLRVSDAA